MKWYDKEMTDKTLWNDYREHYINLSFIERQLLASLWYPKLSDQRCYNPALITEAFKYLTETAGVPLRIVELGCWRGHLAQQILKSTLNASIESWIGYDISKPAIQNSAVMSPKFQSHALDDWFHKTDLPKFNTFVCSHVFEHMRLGEIYNTMEKVVGAYHLILEIPLYSENPDYCYTWNNYCGGHVLIASRNDVKTAIGVFGYKIVHELLQPETKTWITVWR